MADPTMKLHWSPRSPFVRKVMIALHEAGMVDQVTCVRSVVAMMEHPNEAVLKDNPLGQIPTLIPASGPPLYDSRVICEYIDGRASGTKLFPTEPDARYWQLHWQALGDGLITTLLLLRNERLRGDCGARVLIEALETKARACLAALNDELVQLSEHNFGIGHVAIVCALGQLDFRFRNSNWRDVYPELASWLTRLEARHSVAATAVVDDSNPLSGPVPGDLENLEILA